MIPWLTHPEQFPPIEQALREPNGLLAAGGGLSPEWLLSAYRQGIFPWYMPGEPILWWSLDPRMVLFPSELHIGRSLAKVLRNRSYEIRMDTSFREVMLACALPRADGFGSWISEEIVEGYCTLHALGHAHSIETWIDGRLVGGLYGVALGNMFFGESMFALQADASKIAFARFVPWLAEQGFELIDCQMRTHHLARFGAREIAREDFCARLGQLVTQPRSPGLWHHKISNTVGSGS